VFALELTALPKPFCWICGGRFALREERKERKKGREGMKGRCENIPK